MSDGDGRIRLVADLGVPCDGSGRVLTPAVVEIEGDSVVHVGDAPSSAPAVDERLSGVLLPGFVNVHCHSPMTLLRGVGAGLPVDRWLREVLWPRESRLTPADVYWGMTLAAAELLRVGVTTTCELYFHEDALIDAVVDAGSRCLAGPAVLQAGPLASTTFEARLDAVADVHRRRQGEAGRIEVSVAPHAPYTVPAEALRDTAELARSLDALLQIHVAETAAEVDDYRRARGCSPIAGLAADGVLGGRVLAAHSIWLDDDDIGIYAEHGVAVAHCPQSNAKLASGVARLVDLLDAGVRVGLGTDGPASNNDLDPWEEMRAAAMFARIARADAGVIPASVALDLATRSAAAAVDRPDLGSLAPGCKADLVLVDLDDPVFTPLIEPAQIVEHLVWSASGRLVADVWVAGRRVVEAGRCLTVDVAEARRQVTDRARALAAG